jgi:hypothetical protein
MSQSLKWHFQRKKNGDHYSKRPPLFLALQYFLTMYTAFNARKIFVEPYFTSWVAASLRRVHGRVDKGQEKIGPE